MTEQQPTILSNLSLNHWYKYMLYVAGVVLIISLYIEMQFASGNPTASVPALIIKIRNFSIYSIIIGVSVWISMEVTDDIGDYLQDTSNNYSDDIDQILIAVVVIQYIIWIIAFLIWVDIAVKL